MFINTTKLMALFTIAVVSSLIAVGGLTSSAFAETRKSTSQSYLSLPITVGGKSEDRVDDSSDDGPPPAVLDEDRSSSLMSHTDDSSDDGPPPAVLHKDESHNVEDSEWTTEDNNTIPEMHMNGLSNCESSAAADGHLTLVEIMDCFHRVF